MIKKIIGWSVFGGLLLVIGIGILNSITEESSTEPPENSVGVRLPNSEEPFGAQVETNAISFDHSAGVAVENERQTMKTDGDVERKRLVKRAGKYPNRIIIETLHRDRQLKKFVSVGQIEMVADHVLVQLRQGASYEELEQLASQHNASILRSLSDGKTHLIQLEAPGLDAVEEALEFFSKAAAEVAYAEPDYVRHFSKVPNDLLYGDLWGMPKISAPLAWDITTGSKDVVVAVIDTGMDMDHPDLLANRWSNPDEIPGDSLDNDGNGYIDDVNGWDFVTEDNNPDDADGHGTHCAGTIGAVGDNGSQVVGVCWEVSLMPVRAGTGEGLLDSDIVDSIRYAAGNGAKVLSNSYGGPGFSQTTYDAISYANDQGAIFVAASGNDGTDSDVFPKYPASYDLPNIISVAATDEDDKLASFSNYGETSVDLAASGVNIVSTYLNGTTETLQGTSMACPQVAGAMALLVSLDASVTPSEAKTLLLASVDTVAELSDKVVSGGRLNAYALLGNAGDADNDGMPDTWENLYGLNPNDPSDALLDFDADFLNNLMEFQNGCVPTNSDSDADSLIDGWEVQYGFNPLNVHGALPGLEYLGFSGSCLNAYDVAVQDHYAYVADGANGLCILDVSNPENPLLVGSYASEGSARGIQVSGDYAYLSDSVTGLHVIDVSNKAVPQLKSVVAMTAYNSAIEGDYAYVATGTDGLKVVSIANPLAAAIVGNYDTQFVTAYDVAISGNQAYLAGDTYIVKVNVSDRTNPTYVDDSKLLVPSGESSSKSMFFNGLNFYVALDNYGFSVFDSSLLNLARENSAINALGICENDGLVYIADGSNGLVIMNASDLNAVTPYDAYENVFAQNVTFADGYVYVPGLGSGLHVFRVASDADEDGLFDKWELDNFGSLAQGPFSDYDSDGIINWGEYLAGLNPNNDDQDSDTLIDGFDEVQTYLTDPRTDDTDEDGLSDSFEVTTNAVDNFYFTNPLLADTDDDGMTDKWEIDNGLNPLVDDGGLDPDGDGATNREEEAAGTEPQVWDTDSDGMPDGWEIDNGLDPLVNDAAEDPDGDNTIAGIDLTNLGEYALTNAVNFPGATNPKKADSDDDLLGDNWEITNDFRTAINFNGSVITNMYITDPNNPDTDGDGMPDGWEENYYLSPLDDGSININNGASGDIDNDGLTNYEEYLNGSNPYSEDTDNDGFLDEWERDWGTQATNAADPLVVDDDGPFDWWMYGGQPQDPQLSDPDEDGSLQHPFDAIQEAINVAENGNTIIVKEGQYYGIGNREVNPSELQLRIMAENQTNSSLTVVKSHGLGAVFIYEGGQQTNSLLSGFTIQSSMLGLDCSNGDCGEENGIVCRDASSPMITNCVVELCRDDAIYCEFNSSPILSNVTIRTIYEGNGIYAISGSTPKVLGCVIDDIFTGNGIYAIDSAGLEVSGTTITDCANVFDTGRGIWLVNDESASIFDTIIDGCQGGIRCDNSSPTIDRCTLSNNAAPDYYTFGGAGFMANTNIAFQAQSEGSEISDEQNDEENGGGILLMSGSFPEIQNCVIVSNRTWASDPEYSNGNSEKPYYGLGGGIYAGANCATRLINCTVADNSAMTLGGGFTTFGNFVEHMRNDIIWSNTCNAAWLDSDADPVVFRTPGNAFFNALHCNEGTSHFDPWYCDISDGYGFVVDRYNKSEDPLFVGGGDYQITSNSPCIDVGTYYEAPLYDRIGRPRPLDGDTITNNYFTVDMGAYEYLNPNADTDLDGIKDGIEITSLTSDPTLIDSDFDGMTDGFESQYGLNAMDNDAAADADGDGLSNLAESGNGTDPTNSDTDGDNSPDGDEDIAGTIPTDPTSYFYVSDIRPLAEGGCEVVFDTVVDRFYTIYCCSGLGGDWNVVLADMPGDGNPAIVVDSYNEGSCFYKVEVTK